MSILKLGTIYGEIMKIGDLAKATHTKVETIRYYEREGLLHEAVRTMGNYRVYNVEHLDRLSFIRHCRSLDMTLEEIKTLLRYKDFPPEDCSNVNALIDEHIEHVAVRIKELKHLLGYSSPFYYTTAVTPSKVTSQIIAPATIDMQITC